MFKLSLICLLILTLSVFTAVKRDVSQTIKGQFFKNLFLMGIPFFSNFTCEHKDNGSEGDLYAK